MKKILIALVILSALVAGFVATTTFGAHAAPALSKAVVLAQAIHGKHHQSNNLSVHPRNVTETTDGNISFTILGSGLIPHQSYFIDSPTLDYACGFSDNLPVDLTTDFEGRLNYSVSGLGCIAGTYQIYAQDDNTPFTTYLTSVTIKTP